MFTLFGSLLVQKIMWVSVGSLSLWDLLVLGSGVGQTGLHLLTMCSGRPTPSGEGESEELEGREVPLPTEVYNKVLWS